MDENTESTIDLTPAHSPNMPRETTVSQDGAQVFDGSWNATDAAHLNPTNLPVRRILRAWERKLQSPLVKQRSSRKIWRRVDRPVQTTHTKAADPPTNACHAGLHAHGAIHSPRKIVKKRCVFTSFGQNARANHWDQKTGTPLRELPTHLPSTDT